MPDLTTHARHIRSVLALSSADQGLELALSAALEAGRKVLSDYRHRPPAEKFALALQAADEVLEGMGVDLGGQSPEVESPRQRDYSSEAPTGNSVS